MLCVVQLSLKHLAAALQALRWKLGDSALGISYQTPRLGGSSAASGLFHKRLASKVARLAGEARQDALEAVTSGSITDVRSDCSVLHVGWRVQRTCWLQSWCLPLLQLDLCLTV
jgi:hypothetical protein